MASENPFLPRQNSQRSYAEFETVTSTNKKRIHPIVQGVLCCAMLMTRVDNYSILVPGLTEAEHNITLRLHVSLGIGVLHHIYAGILEDRTEYFIAGPAVFDAASTLDRATPGQLAISSEAWKLFHVDLERFRIGKLVPSKIKMTTSPDGLVVISNFDWAAKYALAGQRCFLEPVRPEPIPLKLMEGFLNESLSFKLSQGLAVTSDELNELRK
jgi:hypothetical protein